MSPVYLKRWHGWIFVMLGVGMLTSSTKVPEGTAIGAVSVGLMILSVGLSILAGELLKKKQKSPIQDDKPTTLSTRGSYTNWFLGIRRVGPVFCWAGARQIRKEKVEGAGKGFGSAPEQDVFYESGWHVLGIGPCEALHQILKSGQVIFNGPITKDSHPSGSTVDLGEEGSFDIYWGEVDQPINAYLGDSSRVGISSRWPYACYILWNKKRLGTSPNWPVLTYVVERRPLNTGSLITASDAWYEPVQALTGTVQTIVGSLSSTTPDAGYIELAGDLTRFFKPATQVAIAGNAIADGDLNVLRSELEVTALGPYQYQTTTRVFFLEATFGADSSGTLQPYEEDNSAGANVAHVAAETLFAPFPQGLELNPIGLEPWDMDSFETLGTEAQTDGWRTTVYGSEGETAEALLGALLQDHGVLLPIDTQTGMLKLNPVRFPVGTLKNLPEDVFVGEEAEREVLLGARKVDRLIYEYADRDLQFATVTIAIDDDGQAFFEKHQSSRVVPLSSTTHFPTAASLSELRSPEELADAGEFRLSASREARGLLPGEAILADGFPEVLRVLGVGIDPLSERVMVRTVPDFFGAPKTTFTTEQGGGAPVIEDPSQDAQFDLVEIPEQLNSGSIAALFLHIRNTDLIVGAAIHLSRDNSTYTLWGSDTLVQTGGLLDEELPASGPTWVPTGPEYEEAGPDNADLTQDLSADPTNFGLGRQLCVIVSSAGREICFLQRAVVVDATHRRLDGLMRARYDTRKLTHPVGAKVYIFDESIATVVTDILFETGEDIFVKSQPSTSAGAVTLDGVSPTGKELEGKGLVPIAPDEVQVTAPYKNTAAYLTGDDVTVRAMVSSALSSNTGAGFQNAGAITPAPTISGLLRFELLTTGDVLQDEKSGTSLTQTWTNAELVAALGSEVSFKIRVTHIYNSLTSAPAEITIAKL